MAVLSNLTPNLFGIPYQLPNKVDPKIGDVSKFFGYHFLSNMVNESPVCTIVPGLPEYLPGEKGSRKKNTAMALWEAQGSGIGNIVADLAGNSKTMRMYDFRTAYTEYMAYVNLMCRAGATFLDLDSYYKMPIGDGYGQVDFRSFDWKQFKFNASAVRASTAMSSAYNIFQGLSSRINSSKYNDGAGNNNDLTDFMNSYKYIQFYVDSDVSPQDSLSNSTGESQIKSLFDSGSSMMKDLKFMADSGGLSNFDDFFGDTTNAATEAISGIVGEGNTITGTLSRIINLGGEVLQGNNIVIPDVFQSSTYSKSYSITVHLKSPYGSKLGYYLNIYVPMMHLLALAIPRMSTANSYESPFLVKAYVDGIFSCNLGMVTSINIQKRNESWNVDGLPTEVDVTLDIADLYSALTMAPQTSPGLFLTNSSLTEYMANQCGLSLAEPQLMTKLKNKINLVKGTVFDIPTTVISTVDEGLWRRIRGITSLYGN